MSREVTWITLPEIAGLLLLSVRRIRQLANDNVIPDSEKGKYDLVGCVHGYIRYQNTLIQGQGTLSLAEERTGLTRTNRKLKNLELKEKEGKLIEVDIAMQKWGNVIQQAKSKILSLPSRLAPIVVDCKSISEIKSEAESICHEILFELASPELGKPENKTKEVVTKKDMKRKIKKVKKKVKTKKRKEKKK